MQSVVGAFVYAEGCFGELDGKTANGLVRRSERFDVLGVIDSTREGRDAGEVLDGRSNGVRVFGDLGGALAAAPGRAGALIVGLAPNGGRLDARARRAVVDALARGLDVYSGLHDYLGDDPEFVAAAAASGARIHDVRRPPARPLAVHSGRVHGITALRVLVAGTDCALGKRTTSWLIVDALRRRGLRCVLIGTGQTAALQGARYGVRVDALPNDFVAGELESAMVDAWREERPDVMVVEGQASLLHPAFSPCSLGVLSGSRPHALVLQHAPARRTYDGFPAEPMHSLERHVEAYRVVRTSRAELAGVAVSHEGLARPEVQAYCRWVGDTYGLPACDPLVDGVEALVAALLAAVEAAGAGGAGAR
jgi:uncharacterized NAD-dependent epimerase/dehydratase family protein